MSGTIYVIDLIGFSRMTESRMAMDARRGTETITRLVTALFGQLMQALSAHDIQFGGIAGDALIAWHSHRAPAISETELQSLAQAACENAWPGLACRTAKAGGRFWLGETKAAEQSSPLIWGPAISAAFASLARTPKPPFVQHSQSSNEPTPPNEMLATATVVDRWSVVLRAFSPTACESASPQMVGSLLERVREICDAFSAMIDNVVQDDKGLLVIIVMPPGAERDRSACDALLLNLTTGRDPVASLAELRSKYGTVFRSSPIVFGQSVTITIGRSINQAAKALVRSANPAKEDLRSIPAREHILAHPTIGRDREADKLLESLQFADERAYVTGLVGSAGMGKTTIIQHLRTQTAGSDVLVEVTPGSRYLPYGAAQDLAEACGLSASVVFDTSGQTELAKVLPSTLIIENWQWCDRDSKRLIRRLHQDRRSGLLLISSRQHIDGLTLDTKIDVTPLDLGQSAQLLDAIAPGLLAEPTKGTIHDITSGTPFWLVQAALHAATKGNAATAVENLSGLEALLSARAESLSDPAIALWRLFCAWRHPLSFQFAKQLLRPFDVWASDEHLDELTNLGWIVSEAAPGSEQLRPAHDILADWGSSDIPVSFEQALHSAIARAVAHQQGSPSRVAQHWQKAEQNLRAAVWFDRAAKLADRAGAHALTLEHLNSAKRLSSSANTINKKRELDVLARAATALWGVGKLRRAKQTLSEFEVVAKNTPHCPRKREALLRAATIQSEVGQFAANSTLMTTGIYRGWRYGGPEHGAYEVKARRQGFIYYALGLMRLPIDGRLNKLVTTAHQKREYRSQAVLGCAAATLNMIRCEWGRAEETLSACHTVIAQTDDRQMLGVAQCLLGLCHLYQGQSTAALDWFERVAETGREQDHHMFQVWGAYAKAEAHLYSGDWHMAKTLGLEARANALGLGDHQSVCIIEGTLAQAFAAERDWVSARKHARNAMRFATRIPPTNFSTLEGVAAPAQIGIALHRINGSDSEGDRMIKTGRRVLKKYAQVICMAQPRQLYVEGLIAGTKGDLGRAKRLLSAAQKRAESFGMRYEQNLSISALNSLQETRYGATA